MSNPNDHYKLYTHILINISIMRIVNAFFVQTLLIFIFENIFVPLGFITF